MLLLFFKPIVFIKLNLVYLTYKTQILVVEVSEEKMIL